MKILFACDLDNTLIHSYKYRRAGDICVEHYEGREQSFISPRTLELIKNFSEQNLFIPVTTRSIAQYRRIFWTEDFKPRYAVVTNGAYFLDGDNQENFLREVATPYQDELNRQLAAADENIFSIARIVDESFLFLKCRDDIEPADISFDTNLAVEEGAGNREQGAVKSNPCSLALFPNKKIYLFPPELNKGEALKLLIKRFSPEKVFAAGDSSIDLPMLQLADCSFVIREIGELEKMLSSSMNQ